MSGSLAINDRVLCLQQDSLRIEFRWCEDRFGHSLLWEKEEIGRSLEGDASLAWPPSPPLQDLSLEEINGVPTILGVGAAGRGHWSISVQWDPLAGGFLFDLACRAKELRGAAAGQTGVGILGSQYVMSRSNLLTFSAVAGETIDGSASSVVIRPDLERGGETVRWCYLLSHGSAGEPAQTPRS